MGVGLTRLALHPREYGMEVLPHITLNGNLVTVQHQRDFQWSADGSTTAAYVDRSFDVSRLERVWFVEEPFSIAPFAGRRLFLQLASESQQLESQPRFYNSLSSNCTNELARVANQVQPSAVPPNIGLVFRGYADQELYDLGFIPNNAPFDSIRQRYAITRTVQETIDRPDFSQQLRSRLDVVPASAQQPAPRR